MQVKLFLLGLGFFSLALAQSADNQQKAVAWLETLKQETQQYFETYLSDLQTFSSTTTYEVFDEQGEVSDRDTTKMSVDLENNQLYAETMSFRDGEDEINTTIVTPETGCSIFDGAVEPLSEEERQAYFEFLEPLEQIDPSAAEMADFQYTDVQYEGDFAIEGVISGERVDFTYDEKPMSYIFDADGSVIGILDSEDDQETLTVYRNQDEGSLFGQSALNYDEYLLDGDEPQLIERVRTTEYAVNEALDESLFQCPEEAQ